MKYCVYFHINPLRNEVFYVGKGTPRRVKSKFNRSPLWWNTYRKYGMVVDVVHQGLSETEAFALERFYINRIGTKLPVEGVEKRGSLVNLTSGGEGVSGHPRSKDTVERSAAFHRGRKRTDEAKARMSASQKGRVKTPEHRAKLSAANLGKRFAPLSAEHKAKISASRRKQNHAQPL